ncbi:MAG: hypothetical protein ABJG14_18545 [Sulfitobacter sp.]|uniref:hypothetical protein n=1 Tax=Alphaproteobacteria TaxID=28211 RepID=UPI0032659A8A
MDHYQYLDNTDKENLSRAIKEVGQAFETTTGITVEFDAIMGLQAVREHVLSGGDYPLDLANAMAGLRALPEVSNALLKAEVEQAELSRIQSDTATMSRQDKMNYARERGLTKQRDDLSGSSLSKSEHAQILSTLSPQQRLNYARRHGLA